MIHLLSQFVLAVGAASFSFLLLLIDDLLLVMQSVDERGFFLWRLICFDRWLFFLVDFLPWGDAIPNKPQFIKVGFDHSQLFLERFQII